MSVFNNIPTRTTEQMLEYVKLEFLHGEPGSYLPMIFIGKGGIGKSQAIYDLCKGALTKELGREVGYKDLRLGNFDATDLKGIPIPDKDALKTEWLVNNCYPDEAVDGDRGILVLDEVTSCEEQTQTGVYQLLAERQLNNYKFPDGWMIVCLGNGPEDGGTFNQLTPNFVNRCMLCEVECDKQDWLKWARTHGIHELVLAYVNWEGSTLHGYNPEITGLDGTIFPSPRIYEKVSDRLKYDFVMKSMEKDPTAGIPQIIQDMIVNLLGNTEGSKFIAFAETRKTLIDLDKVLDGTAPPYDLKTEDADKYMSLACEGLVTRLTKLQKGHIDYEGAKKDNALKKDTQDVINTIKWLHSVDRVDYMIRFLSAYLQVPELLGYGNEIIFQENFQEMCPEFKVFMTTVDMAAQL